MKKVMSYGRKIYDRYPFLLMNLQIQNLKWEENIGDKIQHSCKGINVTILTIQHYVSFNVHHCLNPIILFTLKYHI